MKYRSRLLITLITLIMAVLLGLGVLLGQLFKVYLLQTFDQRLVKETNMIDLHVINRGGLNSIDKTGLAKLSKILNVEVTLIDNKGTIAYDSGSLKNTSKADMASRISHVIQNNSKPNVKMAEDDKNDVHYYWKPIAQNGKTLGWIIISTPINDLIHVYRHIWWILLASLGMALIMIILFATRITARYTKPIESATSVAIELAKGNYRARTAVDRMDQTGMLNSAINILARNLQEMVKAQEMQQDRLRVLIENIGAGLILIDSRGYINLINKGYKEIFQVNPSDYLFQLYYEVIEHSEVSRLVEEIFITEQKVSKQLHLPIGIERRYFDVYGVPIIGTNKVWKGVLLVFHDITEMKKLEKMRKDFVANVSHELKTPITSIKGFSETLLDGAMKDKEALEKFLSIILKESDRLQSLIQDLLDLSKIEQQDFKLSIQEFDLVITLKETITMLMGKAEKKNIRLELKSDKETVMIQGDLYRLKQVFINLIANAIAYTPADGFVHVFVNETDDKVKVTVEDSGIGIDKSEIPRIFERFYRIDRARSRNSGGTGLGLAIVKHIVEAHRGSVNVKSVLGQGSKFMIELNKKLRGDG